MLCIQLLYLSWKAEAEIEKMNLSVYLLIYFSEIVYKLYQHYSTHFSIMMASKQRVILSGLHKCILEHWTSKIFLHNLVSFFLTPITQLLYMCAVYHFKDMLSDFFQLCVSFES